MIEDLRLLNQIYFADYEYNATFLCGFTAAKKNPKPHNQQTFPLYSPINMMLKYFKATGSHKHSFVSVIFVPSFGFHFYEHKTPVFHHIHVIIQNAAT